MSVRGGENETSEKKKSCLRTVLASHESLDNIIFHERLILSVTFLILPTSLSGIMAVFNEACFKKSVH